MHTLQEVSESALFEIWLHRLSNYIPVGHSLYTQFTRPCESGWVWLVRLGQTLQASASGLEDEGLEMRSGGSWVNTPGK